ncbi:MAG: hypothetical protein MUC96_38025 [Myxococcaceae bacterium]|nr:hypothetical protein [Myxococcaceae bacterium]
MPGPKRPRSTRPEVSAEPPERLPRDTPVDTPAVTRRAPPLIEPPVLVAPTSVSALSNAPETIEAAYDAWDALRAELAALRATSTAERVRLEEQGALLLGAVKAASSPAAGPAGLVKTSQLEQLADEARRGWEASKAALEARASAAEAEIAKAIDELTAELRRRVEAQATLAPPSLELMVRTLPGDRRILHLRRPAPDDAVLLLFAMSGRCPTRYGFLFDDSTDDGVTLRWLSRGAVLEAEVADGDGFRNLLSREEAEQLTGALLSLKLAGAIELELVRG